MRFDSVKSLFVSNITLMFKSHASSFPVSELYSCLNYSLLAKRPPKAAFSRGCLFPVKYCIVNNTDTHAVGWRAARFGSQVARFTAGHNLPPGFRAARQCFCCKEVVIAHIRVARPLSMKLCTQKINISKKNEKKSYLLRMITGRKECRTEMFRQICARTLKFFFNKQTRYSNLLI